MSPSRRGKLTTRKKRGTNIWRVRIDGAHVGSIYRYGDHWWFHFSGGERSDRIEAESFTKLKTAIRKYFQLR